MTQTEMKVEIQNLADSVHTRDMKIATLETDEHTLEEHRHIRTYTSSESIMHNIELNDQKYRKRNIVIT